MNINKRLESNKIIDVAVIKKNKQRVKLRKLFIEIQQECKDYAKDYALDKRSIKGLSHRSNTKKLYFLERNEWTMACQSKINALHKRAARLGFKDNSKPRDFWLPTIIEHAITIKIVIYQAKVVKKLSIPQARAFAKKHGYDNPDASQPYLAKYSNGRDCKIRVSYENGLENYRFTDIAICICDCKKIPKILKREDNTEGLIPSQPVLLISQH